METWGTEDFALQRIIWPREFNAVIFSSEELDSLPPSLSLAGNDSSLNLTALLLEWEAECDLHLLASTHESANLVDRGGSIHRQIYTCFQKC